MRRAPFVLIVALAAGCSSGGSSTSATPVTASTGGERPVARPISPTATAEAAAPRAMSQEEFDRQWRAAPASSSPFDMSGMVIAGAPGGGPYAAYGGLGYDAEHPVAVCGTVESYTLVASHICPDGSMPLGGDSSAGAGARVGNVGANSTGHVIDLYEVPCSTGPVQLFVDMYGCPGGGIPF